jgi:hypothetical protein
VSSVGQDPEQNCAWHKLGIAKLGPALESDRSYATALSCFQIYRRQQDKSGVSDSV